MSSKMTLSNGENHHLYNEIGDDNIHLQVDGAEFEAYPNSVTVSIPRETWIQMVKDYVKIAKLKIDSRE